MRALCGLRAVGRLVIVSDFVASNVWGQALWQSPGSHTARYAKAVETSPQPECLALDKLDGRSKYQRAVVAQNPTPADEKNARFYDLGHIHGPTGFPLKKVSQRPWTGV